MAKKIIEFKLNANKPNKTIGQLFAEELGWDFIPTIDNFLTWERKEVISFLKKESKKIPAVAEYLATYPPTLEKMEEIYWWYTMHRFLREEVTENGDLVNP